MTHLGRLKAATARVEFGRGHGTAFLVAPRTLLTCAHVLPGAERGDPVTLFFAHALETPWAAQIVEIDTSADVAVLTLENRIFWLNFEGTIQWAVDISHDPPRHICTGPLGDRLFIATQSGCVLHIAWP